MIDDLAQELNFDRSFPHRLASFGDDAEAGRMRSWPRVYGTTQKAQNSLHPSMMVT